MKRLISALLASAMLLSLTACTSKKTDTEATAAPAEEQAAFTPALDTDTAATLYFEGNWGNFEALDQVALDFQKYYPNVEVVYEQLSDYRADLANKFATGEGIDLFMAGWWDTAYTPNQDIIDNAEDLSGAGLDLSSLNADMLAAGQADGAQTMVPIYLETFGYMINVDLFKAAGAEVPTTYEEMLAACEKLKAAGYEQPIFANAKYFGKTYVGYFMDQRANGSDAQQALTDTLAKADEFAATGYVSFDADTLEDSYNAVILRFFEGDIPIVPFPAGQFSGTKKREAKSEAFTAKPFEYAFIPAACGDTNSAYICQCGSIFVGVYKDSKQLDLANEFLRFLLTDDEMLVMQQIKNMPTANVNNGMANFPYLKAAELKYAAAEGVTSVDDEYAIETLNLYSAAGDHTAETEKLTDMMTNGIG